MVMNVSILPLPVSDADFPALPTKRVAREPERKAEGSARNRSESSALLKIDRNNILTIEEPNSRLRLRRTSTTPVDFNFDNKFDYDHDIESASTAVEDEDEEQHELATTWTVWEKLADDTSMGTPQSMRSTKTPSTQEIYDKANTEVKSFNTIEGFMELFNGIPAPSAIINKNHIVRNKAKKDEEQGEHDRRRSSILGAIPLPAGDDNAEQLDAIAFFHQGIKPTWEDPVHKNGGGLFQFTFKTDFPGRAMDEIWERLLFSILGNGVTNSEFVTGVRMADRLPGALTHSAPIIGVRLEVWHKEMTRDQIHALRKHCINILKEPLACGGIARAGRTVRKGEVSTKTAFTYESSKVLEEKETRRRSV